MRILLKIFLFQFLVNELCCVKFLYEIYNYTGKSFNLDIVDDLKITFDKFKYNITAMVKVPLNDVVVSEKITILLSDFEFKSIGKCFIIGQTWKILSNSYKN